MRYFPSLNVSFAVRENLIVRAAQYSSIGRPDFDQYAGGLTQPDLGRAPDVENRILVNNAGIKPWTARTTNLRFEYYFEKVGQLAFTAFRREFADLFSGTIVRATPEFLSFHVRGGEDLCGRRDSAAGGESVEVAAAFRWV